MPIQLIASFWTWHGWPALVSMGTLLLAVATGVLAYLTRKAVGESKRQIDVSTKELGILELQTTALQEEAEAVREQVGAVREQAEATKRQAELSAAALESAARPVLVGVPPDFSKELEQIVYTAWGKPAPSVAGFPRSRVHYQLLDDMLFCSIPLRNVGTGIAFVKRVSLLTGGAGKAYDGRISNVVIAPQELARVRFSLALVDQQGRRTDVNDVTSKGGRGFAQFTILVVYTAASSEIVTASQITVTQMSNVEIRVTSNMVYDGDTTGAPLLVSSENLE